MSKIEIRYFTGDVEERTLSKSQPLSIGQHSSNDICIDEENVDPMHCRIAWNKNGYEIVSANSTGVEVNGTLVKHAQLNSHDVIRIGTVDISVAIDENGSAVVPTVTAQASVAKKKPSKELPDDLFEPNSGPVDNQVEELLADDLFEEEEEDDLAEKPVLKRSTRYARGSEEETDDDEKGEGKEDDAEAGDDSSEEKKGPSLRDRIRKRMDGQSVRPGEHDVLRAKFLYYLGTGAVVLLLVAAVLWFWLNRNAEDKLLDAAIDLHKEGKYSQAEKIYTEFLNKYPRSERANEAHFARGRVKIDKNLSG
ncbi:MAG: FHA domain-containing protein, partial [Planctomycetes bacterium]|nr:FHA domain-containing protein [Planctomycetota bacterium]